MVSFDNIKAIRRDGMSTRINPKVERALRDVMGHVAQAEDDQIEPSLAVLDDDERAEALGLSVAITCYVALDVCQTWPSDADARRMAKGLATLGTTAERSHLGADEIYAYLSRAVFGMEPVGDVIPDEASATRLMVTVAQRAVVANCPNEVSTWEYLDVIEAAIDAASELDPAVIPAAVMRAYYQADHDKLAE